MDHPNLSGSPRHCQSSKTTDSPQRFSFIEYERPAVIAQLKAISPAHGHDNLLGLTKSWENLVAADRGYDRLVPCHLAARIV
jgi:hypothetical protein